MKFLYKNLVFSLLILIKSSSFYPSYGSDYYYITKSDFVCKSYFPDVTGSDELFNKKVSIIDTLKQDTLDGLPGYWVKILESDTPVFSQNLAQFPFPDIPKNSPLSCSEFKKEEINNWPYYSGYCLNMYLTETLNWEQNQNFFIISEADEESYWRVIGDQFNENIISFNSGIQLISQVFNLQNNNSDFEQYYFLNEEIKIWYGYRKDKYGMGLYVINKYGTTQTIIQFDLSVEGFKNIHETIKKSISEGNYKKWDFILSQAEFNRIYNSFLER